MDITRLARLLDADPRAVENLIVQIEAKAPEDRSQLLDELAHTLGFTPGRAPVRIAANVPRSPARTDVADAAAVDLGFD